MTENWLILETSGRVGKIGLARGGAVVRSVALDDTRRHARDLAATVESVLKAESLAPSDLTGVMVGRGPGSYTGLRVGLDVRKGAGLCDRVRTSSRWTPSRPSRSRRRAKRGAYGSSPMRCRSRFTLSSSREIEGGWTAADELRIVVVEEWLALAAAGTWITGPGVKVYADRIPRDEPARSRSGPRAARRERVRGRDNVYRCCHAEEMFALEPLYLRGSSAEEKAKGK